VELQELVEAGRLEEARAVYQRLLPLGRLDMTVKLVQYFKGAMDAVGLRGGATRPPRLALTDAEREVLDAAVAALRATVPA
jgi:4-hydroxy-tetrahydrodipicolinate synthase